MNDFDVTIIGGGIVGLATASALSHLNIRVALVDGHIKSINLNDHVPMVRVAAINAASQQYFLQVGVWDALNRSQRILPFSAISVKEKAGFAKLTAQSDNYCFDNLGYIIENQLMQNVLYQNAMTKKNISFFKANARHVSVCADRAFLALDNGTQLASKLIVGADGAHSWLRENVNIPLIQRRYKHHALIATVETKIAHQACARQLFYPDGIIAFLPLWKEHLSCLVWSAKPNEISLLMKKDPESLGHYLSEISDNWLGPCKFISDKSVFPLTARYCPQFVRDRVVLIGDAAHTIHPLAGQGANLGLQDSKQLVDFISKKLAVGDDFGQKKQLICYQNSRQKDILTMHVAMQSIQDIFDGSSLTKKIVRGVGMNVINATPVLKKEILKYSMGL